MSHAEADPNLPRWSLLSGPFCDPKDRVAASRRGSHLSLPIPADLLYLSVSIGIYRYLSVSRSLLQALCCRSQDCYNDGMISQVGRKLMIIPVGYDCSDQKLQFSIGFQLANQGRTREDKETKPQTGDTVNLLRGPKKQRKTTSIAASS